MRITRRDFMKYCAAAAGALGLTTTDLLKLEKAMASGPTQGGTQVVWINGASCTGCTVSFANTAYFASVQDLLVPWAPAVTAIQTGVPTLSEASIVSLVNNGVLTDTGANGALDLVFMETLSSSVGHRAVLAGESALSASYVLCIEGSIQTESSGNFCKIGSGTTSNSVATRSFMDEVHYYATNPNCAVILAVGTCASYGGIPAARGSETGARGLVSTGNISGGYKKVNTVGLWDYFKATNQTTYHVSSVTVTSGGTGYTAAPIVAFTSGGGSGASATAYIAGGVVVSVVVTNPGSGYTAAPTVGFSGGTAGTDATADANIALTPYLTTSQWNDLMAKTICIPGCPPHPDWIVGTIVYFLTYGAAPLMDKWHRPLDFYGEYQCTNCLWQTNKPGINTKGDPMVNIDNDDQGTFAKGGTLTTGNSPRLYKDKYNSAAEGCLGVMGCKGRKTKADCSFRRWNSDTVGKGGIGWCVQTRGGCHGCTDPRYPDGWGKFFSFK